MDVSRHGTRLERHSNRPFLAGGRRTNALAALAIAAAPAAFVPGTIAVGQAVALQSADAANLDCGIAPVLGPPGVRGTTGYFPQGISVYCPQGSTWMVTVETRLYKLDQATHKWVQVDPTSGTYANVGSYYTSTQHTFTCEASPTNYCYPATYKQPWGVGEWAAYPYTAVGGTDCTAIPTTNMNTCGSFARWD